MALRRLCSLLDLPARGGRLFENAAGSQANILVFRIAGGKLRAWNAHCPHAGALMRPENEMGGKLICFLHQWEFDVDTGACTTVPRCPLRGYRLEVQGLHVMIDVEGDTFEINAEGTQGALAPVIKLRMPTFEED